MRGVIGRGVRLVALALLLAASVMGARVVLPGLATPAQAQSTHEAWGWGFNIRGQVGNGSTTNVTTPTRVLDLPPDDPVIGQAGGRYQSLAVTASGHVYAWGDNSSGQLGAPTTETCSGVPCSTTPVEVLGLPPTDPVVAVASGSFHSLAVTASGQVWAWGGNAFGQLGDGTFTDSPTPVRVLDLPEGDPVVAIAAGGGSSGNQSLAVTASGHVWAWGSGCCGQLGNGSDNDSATPVEVVGLPADDPVIAVSATSLASFALTASGHVWAWGDNSFGQLGNGGISDPSCGCQLTPVEVVGLPANDPVTGIASGRNHTVAVTESGQVWGWGANFNGALGNGTFNNASTPVAVCTTADPDAPCGGRGLPADDPMIQVAAGEEFSMALTKSGHIWSWGQGVSGQLGNGSSGGQAFTNIPVQAVDPAASEPVVAIAAGGDGGHSMAITAPRPTLDVKKALSGSRVGPNDQFTVQIRDVRGAVVSDQTNATTAGSGSAITDGTGTTGTFTGVVGIIYELTEVGADGTSLSHYTQTISCSDANGVQERLPQDAAFHGSIAIRAIPGAAISCTITNTAVPVEPTPTETPTPTPTETPTPTPTSPTTPTPTPTKTALPSQPGLPNTGAPQ